MTGVFDYKVLCLLYQDARKYSSNILASPGSFWLYIGDQIKSRAGGKAASLHHSLPVMALILKQVVLTKTQWSLDQQIALKQNLTELGT